MKINIALVLSAFLAISLVGCSKKPDANVSGTPEDGSAKTAAGPKAAPLPAVPDKLKHEAFKYYGLENAKPLRYKLVVHEGAKPEYGMQTFEYKGLVDGLPQYSVSRTEGLEILGTEEDEVRKDGVYVKSLSLGTLDKPMLAFPADLKPGKTWSAAYSLDTTQGKMTVKAKFAAVRVEKVKVEAGQYDALLVTAQEESTGPQGSTKIFSKAWYAEGIGTVKMTTTGSSPAQKNITMTVELAKEAQ